MGIQNDTDRFFNQEFLITNGIGGYSSSSLSFANTRKYHGLLIASANPPTQRSVLVHKVEERVIIDEESFELSANKYGEYTHPRGFEYLKDFERLPIAKWTYSNNEWTITKEIMMVAESNTVIVQYTNIGPSEINLGLNPLYTQRDYHSILRQNQYDFYYEEFENGFKMHPYPDSKPIYTKYSQGSFVEDRSWYKNFTYAREEYRGMDSTEDSYCVGSITMNLKPGKSGFIVFSDDEKKLNSRPATVRKKLETIFSNTHKEAGENEFLRDLMISGEQFLVKRKSTNSHTILAGYHWFTDWGRDTMIAMRGLTISTGRKKESESILKTFFKYLDQGMLPNRFPDNADQEQEYNTIDATLWLFIVMYEYFEKFEDKKFIKKYIKDLEQILVHHIKGTRYKIHVNDKGFVQGGEDGYQLTWMDAKVHGHVVTPRIGCPVEINVLWYNALQIFSKLSQSIGFESSVEVEKYTKLIKKNFKKEFLNDAGYLNDFIDNDGVANQDFRCNQIYSVSLPFSLLTKKEEKEIIQQVEDKLYTKLGLRSLEKAHPSFVDIYQGDQWSRDTSYHQGTVWTFFIGPYFEAYLKVNNYSKTAKKKVASDLLAYKEHFYNNECIHGISEIFDGDVPKEGRGCINQAWSVAALIKVMVDHEIH